MRSKKNYRLLSNASRIWIAAGNLWPPFCNQMVIEGEGSFNINQLRLAVEQASSVNPGARFIRKGLPGFRKWIDSGITPRVREVDGSLWSGYNPDGASFLSDKLDIDNGPSCEVVLVNGKIQKLVFRTHHAVMDGRGTSTWAEDIFRILRGENPIGSDSIAIEDDFLNFTENVKRPNPGHYIIPSGHPGIEKGFIWSRKKIEGKFSNLLPEIMCIVAREAWKNCDGNIRIGIPVDLRIRRTGFRSTSNLTNAIFFNIYKDTTPEKLGQEIRKRLEEKDDGVLTWEDHILRFIPSPLLKKILYKECRTSKKTGHYRYSAIISNLGNIPLNLFSTDKFQAQSIFFIPPGNEWTPFFITVQGTLTGVEIILNLPLYYGSNGRIDEILEKISAELKKIRVQSND